MPILRQDPPPIGPEVRESSTIGVDGLDRVVRWSINVNTDPAPIMRLLRAKYGRPIDDDGGCSTPGENFYISGRTTWEVDGQRIEALCGWGPSVQLSVGVLDR
jgi:hypothetical protein